MIAARCTALLMALASTGALVAQPYTLTHNEQLPAGSTYQMRAVQNLAAIDTTLGQNVTWQLGDLVGTGNQQTVSILAPGASPYGASFPTANYCIYESVIPRYAYFTNTPDSMSRIGFYVSSLGTYSDPQTELVYPVTYGDSNVDTWANNTVSFPGTFRYDVVGTGTLVLPNGTWNDVLLLRVRAENIIPFFQYLWVSAINGANLLIYTQASLFGGANALMITNLDVGLDDHGQDLDLRVHAPADGLLPITYTASAPMAYRILDAAGRLLANGRLPASLQPGTAYLDIARAATGIHLLELTAGDQRRTVRFFVEQ